MMFQVKKIHMKNKALFSSKDTSKTLKCRLLQLLFGASGLTTKHLKPLIYQLSQMGN